MNADDASLEGPETAQPSQDAMLKEDVERLARAFGSLKPEHRAVLQRSQIDGASHAEIAAETDKSPDAVRKLLARALAALAAELDPEGL